MKARVRCLSLASVLSVLAFCFPALAVTLEGTFTGNTYYVSKTGSNGDAKSWATAKTKIQDAVDLCSAGDTVIVDDGEYSDTTDWEYTDKDGADHVLPTVVQITKRIHLKARNTRKASIIGAWGASNGVGEGAHRCVYAKAANTLVEGFVIRNGATIANTAANNELDNGGGVMAAATTYIVDCDILDCRAGTGAAVGRTGIPIRCYISGNAGVSSSGATGHVFYRSSYAYNCIFERNGSLSSGLSTQGSIGATVQPMTIVNCTFLNNDSAYAFNPNNNNTGISGNAVLNCAFLGHSVDSAEGQIEKIQSVHDYLLYVSNCVEVATKGSSAIDVFGKTTYVNILVGASKSGASPYQYFSPATGDWRLVEGSDLLDAGNEAYTKLSWIPTEYQDADFFGKPRKVGSDVDIGAIENQGEAVKPATGFVRLANTKVKVGDETVVSSVAGRWIGFETFPGQIRLLADFAEPTTLFGFRTVSVEPSTTYCRFPDLGADGGAWLTPHPVGSALDIKAIAAGSELWVDKSYAGGDSDGSAEKPYVTIQEALDQSATYGVVRVKKGVYDTGSKCMTDHTWPARVAVDGHVAIRSVDGPEETVILGDENTRCVTVRSYYHYVQIQGFTLTGGHALGTDGKSSSFEGGAFWVTGQSRPSTNPLSLGSHLSQVTDCIVSNNVAVHAGAMYAGWAQRCHFAENRMQKTGSTERGSAIFLTYASACTFTDNWCENTDAIAPVAYSMCYNTTHYREPRKVRDATTPFRAFEQFTAAFNSAVYDCFLDDVNQSRMGRLSCGNVGSGSNGSYLTNYAKADDLFAAAGNDDYRLCADAAGLRKGDGSATNSAMFAVGDFNGNALTYIDGNPVPGAFSRPVPVVTISDAAALRGTVSPARTLVEEGEDVTFTDLVAKTGHKLVGWFDGVQTNESTATSFTVTVPVGVHTTAFEAGPVFSTDIYVDANAADDTGDGTTPATAMKLLSAAGTCAVEGDTIHAAPGDYNEGSMTATRTIFRNPTSWGYSPSRIVLEKGISLVSEEGPGVTFITGNIGTNANYLGLQAIRGVTAYEKTTVRGFTIRNGATHPVTAQEYDNGDGGCVFAPKAGNAAGTAFIDNCVISNGYARTGGNVWGGILHKCVIRGGHGNSGSTCARYSRLYSCACFAEKNTSVGYHYGIYSSTIYDTGSSNNYELNADDGVSPIENSVLLAQCGGLGESNEPCVLKNLRNCVWFDSGVKYDRGTYVGQRQYQLDEATCSDVTVIESREAAGLDADLKPTRDSVAVDEGDTALLAKLPDAETDLAGTPRVLNGGKVDCGAYEHDWRVDYAAALGLRLVVTACDPMVELVEGQVRVPAGEGLEVAGPKWKKDDSVQLTVGDIQGTLNVYAEDGTSPVLTVTAAGTYQLTVANDSPSFRFVVDADGSADLAGFKRLSGMILIVR